jgi:hypothetical protein
MASSIGFRDSVSFLLTIQATGVLTFTLVGLFPTEYASLRWTHQHAGLARRTPGMNSNYGLRLLFYAFSSRTPGRAPGFLKSEGPLYEGGPVRRIEMASRTFRVRSGSDSNLIMKLLEVFGGFAWHQARIRRCAIHLAVDFA